MRRAILLTAGAAIVTGVANGLARDARSLNPGMARMLLLALLLFLVFEWAAHLLGSRLWGGPRIGRSDRAAWAALSSAGIWIALLAIVPLAVAEFGYSVVDPVALGAMTLAAATALGVRLWFIREIYEIKLGRAATMWAATRGAAVLIALVVAGMYIAVHSASAPEMPTLSIYP